jgi:GTP cyclohydrolase III
VFNQESFIQIKAKMKEAEKHAEQLEQAAAKAEQEAAQAAQQAEQKRHEELITDNQLDRDNKIEIAHISHPPAQPEQPDYTADTKVQADIAAKDRDLDIKRDALDETKRSNRAKEAIARKAKQNPPSK